MKPETARSLLASQRSPHAAATFALSALLLLAGAVPAFADSLSEARSFFQNYQKLSSANDPKLSQLYADDAVIINTRFYPNGQQKQLSFTGKQFKALLISTAALAKAQGDRDIFSQISFKEAGPKVDIKAMRHSQRKNYDSWFLQTIAKSGSQWIIVREESQSR